MEQLHHDLATDHKVIIQCLRSSVSRFAHIPRSMAGNLNGSTVKFANLINQCVTYMYRVLIIRCVAAWSKNDAIMNKYWNNARATTVSLGADIRLAENQHWHLRIPLPIQPLITFLHLELNSTAITSHTL